MKGSNRMKTNNQAREDSILTEATLQDAKTCLAQDVLEMKTLLEINEHLHHLASCREAGGAQLSWSAVAGLISIQYRVMQSVDQHLDELMSAIRVKEGGAL